MDEEMGEALSGEWLGVRGVVQETNEVRKALGRASG